MSTTLYIILQTLGIMCALIACFEMFEGFPPFSVWFWGSMGLAYNYWIDEWGKMRVIKTFDNMKIKLKKIKGSAV